MNRCFVGLVSVLLLATVRCAAEVSVTKDDKTGDVVLSNEMVRVRFHAAKTGRFGFFPRGYTGYTLDLKTDGRWQPMAVADYFTSYVYRSGWGRDWLAYVLPQGVEVSRSPDAASVTFTETQADFDAVTWRFTFRFEVQPGRPMVDVTYTTVPDKPSKLILFWGPRLYVGEGTFGSARDEAVFPGLEYLGPNGRSSANPALAPDARMYFVPTPAKITIPLMAVVHKGVMAGIVWDPMQKWYAEETCPSALFASPNWIEDRSNHLLGLFVPSVPKYVAENGFRAHTPVEIGAGQQVTVSARLFAAPGTRVVDAVDLYFNESGGLPEPPAAPMSHPAFFDMVMRSVVESYDAKSRAWPKHYAGGTDGGPWLMPTIDLIECAPLLEDRDLARKALEVAREALANHVERPLELALRIGNLLEGLRIKRADAEERIKKQRPNGSWGYVPTDQAEAGLMGLHAPPHQDQVAREGETSQGSTAHELAGLWDYVLITDDQSALKAALKGLRELDRYTIPFVMHQAECPPAPSLHGSYNAVRCYLAAYRITGERKHLDKAVYWAKAGLPFFYLWSLPPREVSQGYIHCLERIYVSGDKLYANTRRPPMLYGGLYGYGSSQFSHHWYGILVHWIALAHAGVLADLAECDSSLPWQRLMDGIVTSAMWQVFDNGPYSAHLPDAFSLDTWQPSGPAFSPHRVLDFYLPHIARDLRSSGNPGGSAVWPSRLPQTAVAREGGKRCHVTSAKMPQDVSLRNGVLSFKLFDPNWECSRAIVSGLPANLRVTLDGKPLPRSEDLEAQQECWSPGPQGLTLIKVRAIERPRLVEIRWQSSS